MQKILLNFCAACAAWFLCGYTASAQDMCWRDTYGLGIGTAPASCSSDQEKQGALCYPKCRDGYTGVLTSCHQSCPSDFRDDGLTCAKTWDVKAAHYVNPNCPSGMTDRGAFCSKDQNYDRQTQTAQCGPGLVYDTGLCYPAAKAGYLGVGPVAWMQCPASHHVPCGAGCATSEAACQQDINAMVVSVVEVALKIAEAATSAGTSLAIDTAGSAADLLTQVAKAVPAGATQDSLKQSLMDAATRKGSQLDPDTANAVAGAAIQAKQGEPIDFQSLDPSGVAKVVKAFDLPLCNAAELQPTIGPGQTGQQSAANTVGRNEVVGLSGKCLDVSGAIAADGTPVILYDCHNSPNQRWTVQGDGSIQGLGGKCLDVSGNDATSVILYDCHGSSNQKWSQKSDGTIRGPGDRCLDVTGGNSANGTGVILWNCNGGINQRWAIQ